MFSFGDFGSSHGYHGDPDLDIDSADKVCRYHFHGTCRQGDDCCYSHDPAKVAICRFFSKGTCRHGNKCWFRHQRGDVMDQREKFNLTLYKEKEKEQRKKFEEEMAISHAKKKKEELAIYSANPYATQPNPDDTELDFTEAMKKMRDIRRLYFPLHMKKADLSWVDDRIKSMQEGLDEAGMDQLDKRIFKFEMAGIHHLEDLKKKQSLNDGRSQMECAQLAEEIARIAQQYPNDSHHDRAQSPRVENGMEREMQLNTPDVPMPPRAPVNTPHDERWTAQTNILAYRFSLDDIFAKHHIRHWSLEQVFEFYQEAREGDFPWPELNAMLFNVYRPTPKAWAEFFLKFLPDAVDEDDAERMSEIDEETGLTLEDVTLSEILGKWMEESDVTELHIGGVFAGLRELNPEKYTLECLAQITEFLAGTGHWRLDTSSEKIRAFIAVGFGRCTSFDTFCAFMHCLLKAGAMADEFEIQLNCQCTSFECKCQGCYRIEWEEAGKVIQIVAEHMCKTSEEKQEFFAKSTMRFWQPPIMAQVYKTFIDPHHEDPLKNCDPVPLSKEAMRADIHKNFSKEDHDYFERVLKLNEAGDSTDPDSRPDSQISTVASSEFETASEDETGFKSDQGESEIRKVCLKKEDKDEAVSVKHEKKKSVSFSDESYSTPCPDLDDPYSDYADEMELDKVKKEARSPKENSRKPKQPASPHKSKSPQNRNKKSPTPLKDVTNKSPGGTVKSPGNPAKSPGNTTKSPGNTAKSTGNTAKSTGNTTKSPGNAAKSTGNTVKIPANTVQSEEKPSVPNGKCTKYDALRKAADETGKCQGRLGGVNGRPCQNCPKKDCIQGMCRRCCDRNGLRLCDPHDEPRNIFEAVERIVHPENHQDKWDDSMEYYTIVPSKHFNKQEEFVAFLSGDYPTLRRVSFGSDFGIRDEHVMKVAEAFNTSLMVLELGCSDTGDGTWVTEKGVAAITQHCPNLIKLKLESCTSIGDNAVIGIWHNCPKLKHLQVSGHDKSDGKVTKNALKPLFEDPNLVPDLIFLCLTDQAVGDDIISRLRRARTDLAVVSGSTAEDIFDKMARLGFDEYDDFSDDSDCYGYRM